MRTLNLHIKTTLLMLAITLCVIVALLLVISARVVDVVRSDERLLTEAASAKLAKHFGRFNDGPGPLELEQATILIQGSRLDEISIKLWERNGDRFESSQTNSKQTKGAIILQDDVSSSLLRLETVKILDDQETDAHNTIYSVITPIVRQGEVIGAIEVSDQLENLPKVIRQTLGTALVIALIAITLISVATYILFRDLIHQPIAMLLAVIDRAGSGQLDVQAQEERKDELGMLARAFNRMLRQLNEMSTERERQREILVDRVHKATFQLEERNKQLEAANQELWKTTRQLTQFERLAAAGQTAAQFAHEVGTPLNLIGCQAQLLQAADREKPEIVHERAEIIVEQTERIERIVRQMLDRSRVESPRMQLIDLNAIVTRIKDTTAPILYEREVRLNLMLESSLPKISGDSDKVQQILINLINNALDAMPSGGEISIASFINHQTEDKSTVAVVTVSDTGCGMSNEVLAHIFDPLYTTKERGRGTGLGLVVVHQIMQEHGGRIQAESALDEGTVFRLEFPTVGELQAELSINTPDS